MDSEDKLLLIENNLILRTWVKIKLFETINEIKKIGIDKMDLETVVYYRNLIGELLIPCGCGMPLYDFYGEKLYELVDELNERYNKLYAEHQSNAIKVAKEELVNNG